MARVRVREFCERECVCSRGECASMFAGDPKFHDVHRETIGGREIFLRVRTRLML